MIYNIDIVAGGDSLKKEVRTVNTWGNSLGLRLPSKICDWLHLRNGDQVKIELDESASRIIITKK
jgi:antitoxin component of MazEF toxin-antitoxin module